MQPCLFVEQQATGTAFYIDGELQFHSADERIYHEYLVIPALSLAQQRFQGQELRVLICGGGDGLAVREVLRFPEVIHVDLVDYDPAVIELAKTEFTPFNQHSLTDERVQVHIHEAFDFLRQQAATSQNQSALYHVIICDFTYPLRQEYTDIYAQEWFSLLRSRLVEHGLLAVNGFSPNHNTIAFWCLYQTIRAAAFHCLPMWLDVPSFTNHDYGYWGFMLASTTAVTRESVMQLNLPKGLHTLTLASLCQSFCLPKDLVSSLPMARVHHQGSSQLFFYLLNRKSIAINHDMPETALSSELQPTEVIDFLDYVPQALPQEPERDPLAMETLAQEWLHLSQQCLSQECLSQEHLAQQYLSQSHLDDRNRDQRKIPQNNPQGMMPEQLPFPVQHIYHTPEMMNLWRERLQYLLNYLDWQQLFEKLTAKNTKQNNHQNANSQGLPPDDVARLERIYANIAPMPLGDGQPCKLRTDQLPKISVSELITATRTVTLVGLTLLLANTAAPDAAFAKGGFFGISTSSSGSSGNDGGFFSWGLTGLFLTVGGITWLNSLAETERQEREAQNQAPPEDDD